MSTHITGRLELFRFFWPEAGCIRTSPTNRILPETEDAKKRKTRGLPKYIFRYTEKSPIRNCRTGLPCSFSFYRAAAIFSVSLPCAAANIFYLFASRFCGKWSVAPAGWPEHAGLPTASWCPQSTTCMASKIVVRKVHNLAFFDILQPHNYLIPYDCMAKNFLRAVSCQCALYRR